MRFFSLFFLITFIGFSQSNTMKEVREYHDNGKEKTVFYKNDDLQVVKTQEFDFHGNILSSYNVDPITKRYHGEFIDVPNSGFYDQGKITCESCYLPVTNYNNPGINQALVLKGDFVNGRPSGEIDVYKVLDKDIGNCYQNRNPLLEDLLEYSLIRRIQYINTYGLYFQPYCNDDALEYAEYPLEYKLTLNYDDEGELNGQMSINEYSDLYFESGVLQGFTTKLRGQPNVIKDSIFRNNKIWKVDNVFKKNYGFLTNFFWDEYFSPWAFRFEYHDPTEANKTGNSPYLYFFGSSNSTAISDSDFDRYGTDYHIGFELKERTGNAVPEIDQNKRTITTIWWDPEADNKIEEHFYDYQNVKSVWDSVSEIFERLNLADEPNQNLPADVLVSNENVFCALVTTSMIYEGQRELYLDELLDVILTKMLPHPDSPISNIYLAQGDVYTPIPDIDQFKEIILESEEMNRVLSLLKAKTNALEAVFADDSIKEQEGFNYADNINSELLDLIIEAEALPKKVDAQNNEIKNKKVENFLTAAQRVNEKFTSVKNDRIKYANAQTLIQEADNLIDNELFYRAKDKYEQASQLLKAILNSNLLNHEDLQKTLEGKQKGLFNLMAKQIEGDLTDYKYFLATLNSIDINLSLDLMPQPYSFSKTTGVSSKSTRGYYEAVSLDYRTAFEDFAGDGSTRFFLKNRPKEEAAESLQLRDKILDNIIRLNNYLKTFDKDFYHYKSMLYPTGVAFLLRFSSKIKDDAFGFSKDEFKVFNKYWKERPAGIFAYYNFNDDQFYFFPYGLTSMVTGQDAEFKDVLSRLTTEEAIDQFRSSEEWLFRVFTF